MIGVWGQGLTEELFDRDVRSMTVMNSPRRNWGYSEDYIQRLLTESGFDAAKQAYTQKMRGSNLCQVAYQDELDRIRKVEAISDEDLEVKGGQGSFQSSGSSTTLTKAREANEAQRKRCHAEMRRIAAINAEVAFQDKVRRLRREAEARAQMGLTPQKRGFNFWLIPLLALIPLGFLLFRRKV